MRRQNYITTDFKNPIKSISKFVKFETPHSPRLKTLKTEVNKYYIYLTIPVCEVLLLLNLHTQPRNPGGRDGSNRLKYRGSYKGFNSPVNLFLQQFFILFELDRQIQLLETSLIIKTEIFQKKI